MNKLTEKLIDISKSFPLHENFNWKLPDNCPLSFPEGMSSEFDRNIYLKHNLSKILSVNDLSNQYWLIREWGGIRSFKKNDRNDVLLLKLDDELDRGVLTRPSFSVISSLSKVASFKDPKKYAIYDSRVIYSLNWLLFKHTNTSEFFPQPSGRNAELSKYELNTIFNFSDREIAYKSHKTAYHHYCNLLKELALDVYSSSYPYQIEMLLFAIAPSYIVDDIKKSVKLSLH